MNVANIGLKTGDLTTKQIVKIIDDVLTDFFAKNKAYNHFKSNKLKKQPFTGIKMPLADGTMPYYPDYDYSYTNKYFYWLAIILTPNQNAAGETYCQESGVDWYLTFRVSETFDIDSECRLTSVAHYSFEALLNSILDALPCERVFIQGE